MKRACSQLDARPVDQLDETFRTDRPSTLRPIHDDRIRDGLARGEAVPGVDDLAPPRDGSLSGWGHLSFEQSMPFAYIALADRVPAGESLPGTRRRLTTLGQRIPVRASISVPGRCMVRIGELRCMTMVRATARTANRRNVGACPRWSCSSPASGGPAGAAIPAASIAVLTTRPCSSGGVTLIRAAKSVAFAGVATKNVRSYSRVDHPAAAAPHRPPSLLPADPL